LRDIVHLAKPVANGRQPSASRPRSPRQCGRICSSSAVRATWWWSKTSCARQRETSGRGVGCVGASNCNGHAAKSRTAAAAPQQPVRCRPHPNCCAAKSAKTLWFREGEVGEPPKSKWKHKKRYQKLQNQVQALEAIAKQTRFRKQIDIRKFAYHLSRPAEVVYATSAES
jgi:hypothetical protein